MEAKEQSQRAECAASTPTSHVRYADGCTHRKCGWSGCSIDVGRFLDALTQAQLSERTPCVGQAAMQDLLNLTDALSVQPLLCLHRTKMHERIRQVAPA